MKTVILDDDPTGTQTAAGVTVLLRWDADAIASVLAREETVYLQTNSRAIRQDAAVAQAVGIRRVLADVSESLNTDVHVVLRGDSTLRGHVFAECAVFATDAPVLFVPAFPSAGRRTLKGVHLVRVGEAEVPAAETEFASDPVFGYSDSDLVSYVRTGGAGTARRLGIEELRTAPGALIGALRQSAAGEFVVPDVETDADLLLIADAVRRFWSAGGRVVVRSAAPLAAMLGGCFSDVAPHLPVSSGAGLLVVCGSHTAASTSQLANLTKNLDLDPNFLSTDAAISDPDVAGRRLAEAARMDLDRDGITVISTDRVRRDSDGTIEDAARVMSALVTAAGILAPDVGGVITKGGITAAEVIGTAFGADSAVVLGPVEIGVPVWQLDRSGAPVTAVIVPGNVGDQGLLSRMVQLMRSRTTGRIAP